MTQRSPFFFSVLCLAFALAGCPSDPAPTDSGPAVDTGAVDAPRDAPPRPDTPAGPDALDAARAATSAFIPVFCACIAPRVDPPITEAACVAQNQPDAPYDACERVAFNAAEAGLSAYFACLAEATAARQACFEASDCSETATDACDATSTTASRACLDLITDEVARTTFIDTNAECVEDTITGASTGNCLESGAAISSVGAMVFEGTTVLGGNHTEPTPSCIQFRTGDAAGSPDRAHRWRAPMAGIYRIDTIGSDFDTVLYARETCATTQFACNDDVPEADPATNNSQIDVTLATDQEIAIIVDGFGETVRGNYVVNITYLGMADAGPGLPDAGPTDAGVGMDAGTDAGVPDAGVTSDAGPPAVEVLSCTGLTPVATINAGTGAYVFTPSGSTFSVGDVIQFVPGSSAHDMTSGSGTTADGRFQTTLGATECLRFNAAGTYPFFCSVHLFMGTLTVTP